MGMSGAIATLFFLLPLVNVVAFWMAGIKKGELAPNRWGPPVG
jgi:hypothetical protein